jgi:hypothetical protein
MYAICPSPPVPSIRKSKGGIDQSNMRERLRKITNHALCGEIIFFGEKTDVILKGQHFFHQFLGVCVAPHESVGFRQPEGAGQENAFAGRKPIVDFMRVVAQDEAIAFEILFNGVHRSYKPWI